MAGKIKDCEKMTEGQLLRELVRRFIAYDKARDRYVSFLEHIRRSGSGARPWTTLNLMVRSFTLL